MNKLIAFSFCAMMLATACNSSEEPKPQAVAKKVETTQPAAAVVEQKVAQLVEVLTNDSSVAGKSQKEREDILFRRAIVELA